MTAEKRAPGRPKKWRRRLLRIALWGAVLLVVARIGLGLAMPWILSRVAASQGLVCSYDSMNLSLLAGHMELWHLELRPRADGDGDPTSNPVVRLEYATVDLDVTALLTGDIVVRRAEIDGLEAHLSRDTDGTVRLAGVTAAEPEPASSTEVEPVSEPARRALDLNPPVVVHAARVQGVALHVRDVSEGRTRTWHLDVALSHLGTQDRDAELSVDLWSPGALEALRVRGRGRGGIASLAADLEVIGRGLRPHALEPLLASVDLAPAADSVDFGLRIRARLSPDGSEDPTAHLTVDVERIHWRADGTESLGLDRLKLAVPALERTAAENAELTLRGLRALVTRTRSGRTRWGGFELLPVEAEGPTDTAPPPVARADGEPFRLHVARCAIHDVALELQDLAVRPASDLRLELPRLTVSEWSAGSAAVGTSTEPTTLTARARIPDSVEELSIEASLSRTPGRRAFDMRMAGEGVTLESLRPWLRAAGLEPTLGNGRLSLQITGGLEPDEDGGIAGDLELKDLVLRDGKELLRLDSIAVRELRSGPDRLHVAEIAVQGPALPLLHEDDGSMVFAGLRTVEPSPAPAAEAVEASVPEPTSDHASAVVIDRVTWHGLDVRWTDEQLQPPLEWELQDLEVTVTGIALGTGGEREPARLEAALVVPDLARRVELSGELQHRAADRSLTAELDVRGEGLSLKRVRPYLESLGLEPLLEDGNLRLALSGQLRQLPDGSHASLTVRDVSLQDGDREWLALDRLEIGDTHLEARGTDVESVVLRGLRVTAERDVDGVVALLGVALQPVAASERSGTGTTPAADSAAALPPPPLRLQQLSLEEAEVRWSDASLREPLEITARVRLGLEGLDTGSGETPAEWHARLQIPGELEDLQVEGSLALAEAGPSVTAALRAEGLGPDRLAAYLPAGIASAMTDSRLRVHIGASSSVGPDGKGRTRLAVSDLDYRNDGDAEPLLAAKSVVAAVRSSDSELVLEELTTQGVATTLRDTGEGLEALGLRFTAAQSAAASVAGTEAPATPEPGRAATRALPWQRILVEKMDLGVERLLWKSGDNGGRDIVASLRIATPGPQVLVDEDFEELEPVIVEVTGSVDGVLDEWIARWRVRPFTADPELEIAFSASGLSGPGLMASLPALAKKLDAGDLEDGSLAWDLHVRLRMPRRSPTELDFSRPFGATLELEDLEFRATEGGPVLAGVEALTVEVARVQPGSGRLHVAFLEAYEPSLKATRRADGLHALGILWKDAPPAEQEKERATPPDEPEAAGGGGGPALRVDLVSLQGLDLDFVDESVEPPLPVPLRDLEVEVRGFNSDPERRGPVRFRATVGSGTVPLPERDYSSLVGGILSAATGVVTGGKDRQIEQRPFFDEIAASGSIRFEPLRGWVRIGLRSLEMLNLRGLAASSGVEIGDGLLDAAFELVFRENDDLAIDSNLVFQYLSLSEPAGGPVSSYLKLPAPLDTVLFVLRDSSGEHVVPLSFTVEQDGLSGGQIASAAVGAFGQLVATAIAKSPLRVAGTVTDLFGLTGGRREQVEHEPVSLIFPAGSAALGPAQRRVLEPLVQLLLDDEQLSVAVQHRLGTADVLRAAALANPGTEETRELGLRLRQRKAELVLQRDRTLAEARALWAAGDAVGGAVAGERLRTLDRELGRTEQALDEVYGLLRPGAQRRRDARTRDAARTVARMRMLTIRDYLAQRGVTDVEARYETRRPRFRTEEGRKQGEVVLQPRIRLLR